MANKHPLRYFTGSLTTLVLAVGIGYYIGYTSGAGGLAGALTAAWAVFVLSVLETSLSFDNAVVNAKILENWNHFWRQLFLWVGLPIAVFGMRLFFPILIVSLATGFGMIETVSLAVSSPETYASALRSVQHQVEAFGGAFLMMVAFEFFIDAGKKHHWLPGIERFLAKLGTYQKGVGMAVVLTLLILVSNQLPEVEKAEFLLAGVYGLITYVGARFFAQVLSGGGDVHDKIVRQGVGGFIYLELLDASFSFDGVIGAFAISSNIFIITLGLGVGAMFVRSFTIFLVDRGTLNEYRFLEHGALWAIFALAAIMILNPIAHIPEVVTGFIGAVLIVFAIISSIRVNKRELAAAE
jgi:uncharacterized protein